MTEADAKKAKEILDSHIGKPGYPVCEYHIQGVNRDYAVYGYDAQGNEIERIYSL